MCSRVVDDIIISNQDWDKMSDGINGICYMILFWTENSVKIALMIKVMETHLK